MQTKEEVQDYQTAYYEAHKAEKLAYQAAYYAEHKWEARDYRIAYYEENKGEILAYNRAYKELHHEELRERAVRKRRWFVDNLRILRAAQGCEDCGIHVGWLEHHHLNPATKKYKVSQMWTRSLDAFIDEIAKCTVLCSSCHKNRHMEMKNESKEN